MKRTKKARRPSNPNGQRRLGAEGRKAETHLKCENAKSKAKGKRVAHKRVLASFAGKNVTRHFRPAGVMAAMLIAVQAVIMLVAIVSLPTSHIAGNTATTPAMYSADDSDALPTMRSLDDSDALPAVCSLDDPLAISDTSEEEFSSNTQDEDYVQETKTYVSTQNRMLMSLMDDLEENTLDGISMQNEQSLDMTANESKADDFESDTFDSEEQKSDEVSESEEHDTGIAVASEVININDSITAPEEPDTSTTETSEPSKPDDTTAPEEPDTSIPETFEPSKPDDTTAPEEPDTSITETSEISKPDGIMVLRESGSEEAPASDDIQVQDEDIQEEEKKPWIEQWQPLTDELITGLGNLIYGEVGGYISTQPYDKAIYIYELTGSVPLHRLECGYTPGATNLADVVHAPGQFSTKYKFDNNNRIGVEECYEVAERLLREGPVGPRNLVYQSTKKQGTPYWDTGSDVHYRTTYFGTSSKFDDYDE